MDVRNRQRGFTLVELMVVVAMVGILSAIGLPRILTYVRTSASAEVSQNAALIASAISTYAQSQRKTAAAISAEINNRDVTPDLSGDNELSATLPLIRLPPDSHFDYSIVAMVVTGGASAREVVFYITATGRQSAAVEGGALFERRHQCAGLGGAYQSHGVRERRYKFGRGYSGRLLQRRSHGSSHMRKMPRRRLGD